jgi:UDP-GlcNAc:undecaprenyl-phosphate GlcNAc-1-phosphate transferase
MMALSVPLIDTSLAILRRFLRGQHIFLPDRSHIHHRLLALGLTHRRAVLFLYSAGAVASFLSLTLIWAHSHGEALILLAFISVAIFGIERLGYPELNAARKVLLRGGLRREISAQLEVQSLQESLRAAHSAEDCWTAVQRNSSRLGFEIVRMRLGNQVFGATDATMHSSVIRIAISEQDWLDLSLDAETDKQPNILLPFVTTMQTVLAGKGISLDEQPEVAGFPSVFHETVSSTIQ